MSRQPDPTSENPDRDEDEDTDLDGDDSFPASDPPAHWMGEDKVDSKERKEDREDKDS